ncbi:MAG: hypothetical protein D6791_03390 [Chloroflexi bacterium]|nr:MAG: hypothetical protein D6791_03390 [Chloroflexota bacterium]
MRFPTRTINLLLLWILFSLLAIAYIGQHPFLGLGIAIIGGIILGIMSFLYYEPQSPANTPEEIDNREGDTAARDGE